ADQRIHEQGDELVRALRARQLDKGVVGLISVGVLGKGGPAARAAGDDLGLALRVGDSGNAHDRGSFGFESTARGPAASTWRPSSRWSCSSPSRTRESLSDGKEYVRHRPLLASGDATRLSDQPCAG